MGKNRYINTEFWSDTFIEDLEPNFKYLFLYLLTNPLCNIAGIYEISIKRITNETGLKKEVVEKGFQRLEKASKVLYVNNHVVMLNFIKHQKLNDNIKKGINTIIQNLALNIANTKGFERLCKALNYINLNYNLNLNLNINTNGELPEEETPSNDFFETKEDNKKKTLEERIKQFEDEVLEYRDKYGLAMCEDFINYWSEPDNKGKMKRELQKTWSTKGRLSTWSKNNFNGNAKSEVIAPQETEETRLIKEQLRKKQLEKQTG